MVIGYKKHLDEANRLPTKKDVSYALDSSSGYSHLSSFIGVIDVKDHYNFVVAQLLVSITTNGCTALELG